MTGEAVQKILKEEINSLKFEIPADVFQFTLNQNEAARYLETHPNVPFILRISSLEGYFTLDIPAKDRKSIGRTLISQSKTDENEFKLFGIENGVFTEGRNLKEYVKEYWDPAQKCILSDSELAERKNEVWENYKHIKQHEFEVRLAEEEVRRAKEEAKESSRLREKAHDEWLLRIISENNERIKNLPQERTVTQQDFDLFMASPVTQQRMHQGSGFFQGQAGQQKQQDLNNFPQETQSQNSNTGF